MNGGGGSDQWKFRRISRLRYTLRAFSGQRLALPLLPSLSSIELHKQDRRPGSKRPYSNLFHSAMTQGDPCEMQRGAKILGVAERWASADRPK